jgi:hypothetical protein
MSLKSYTPTLATLDLASVLQEFAAIVQAANREEPFIELQVRHAEPARVRAGMVALADGVDWNPGSGEGLYRRDKTNASWIFLG